jgi:prepilin-type N-terminal cleavage/methylation domain-containing protein
MEVSKSISRRRTSGYTLVEVLVASSILVMGISAACIMSLAMVTQEEMNHRIGRAMNHHENAARLYQLGLDTTTIQNILPANPDLTLSFEAADGAVTGVGTLDAQTITATIYTTPADSALPNAARGWTGGARRSDSTVSRATRTDTLTVYRAAIP